jgi:arylsulfatase A-like enzyme
MTRFLLPSASTYTVVFLIFGLLITNDLPGFSAESAAARPNFVVILSDDMGYSDLGCYGGEIHTPNLDKIASQGIRFTQFYNTARCCPTRASLLTGLYPHQAGVGQMMDDRGLPGYQGNLNSQCRTIAEMLKPAGYSSYAVGKWHVTRHAGQEGPKDNWPLQRGFNRFYGTIHGAGSFFDPSSLVRDNNMISPFADEEYKPDTYYYTDAISDQAVRFIEEHKKGQVDKPFFLYVAYTAAHWPMHALPEDIQKYRGAYNEGYDTIRKKRLQKGSELGVIDAKQGLAPASKDWSKVQDREWEIACMEVYAAMVDRMDQGIGKIRNQLDRNGFLENTVILYMQDNGGCAEAMGRTGNAKHPNIPRPTFPTLPAMKPTDFASAGSVPDQTRDGLPVRMGNNAMPGPADTYVAYGEGWANVSNTPFREYKHWVHEGGISTPLIACWPQGISKPGAIATDPGHLIDVAATLVDLAGATSLTDATPLEGVSLRPIFEGKSIQREAIYWEHEGNRAVRAGKWKLVAKHGMAWELYDLESDRIESKDLAAQQPAKVAELKALYEAYAKRANVEPWPLRK